MQSLLAIHALHVMSMTEQSLAAAGGGPGDRAHAAPNHAIGAGASRMSSACLSQEPSFGSIAGARRAPAAPGCAAAFVLVACLLSNGAGAISPGDVLTIRFAANSDRFLLEVRSLAPRRPAQVASAPPEGPDASFCSG